MEKIVAKIERKLDENVDDNILQYCSLDNQVRPITRSRQVPDSGRGLAPKH